MVKKFDADAFTRREFVWGGKPYSFRPASIRTILDYFEGDLQERFAKAVVTELVPDDDGTPIPIDRQDLNKILELKSEGIRKIIPDLSAEDIESMPGHVVNLLFRFVQDGEPPEISEKN